jgi:hypothetical protein
MTLLNFSTVSTKTWIANDVLCDEKVADPWLVAYQNSNSGRMDCYGVNISGDYVITLHGVSQDSLISSVLQSKL